MFKMKFSTDNTVFEDYKEQEVSRILAEVVEKIEKCGKTEGFIMDINGNKIGEWSLTQ